jgi:hypothetical protein
MLQCDNVLWLIQWYILNEIYSEKYHPVYHHRHSCVRHSVYHIVLILLYLR